MNNGEGVQEAAEILRLVIPRLSSLGWPVNPINYALWYEYFVSDNEVLKSQLDELASGDHVWEPELAEELFKTHVLGESTDRLDNISQDVRSLLTQVLSLVSDAGDGVENFSCTLKEAEQALTSNSSAAELSSVVGLLLKETETVLDSSTLYKEQLVASGNEVERLRNDLEQVKQEALRDPLTGLGNRKKLDQDMASVLDAVSGGEQACVIMLDVDHFKRLNDRFGHLVGDKVLKFLASTLTAAVKGRDSVVRYGGEEFCIVLREITPEGAKSVAEGIRKSVQDAKLKRSETGESLGRVTISLGVTAVSAGEEAEETLNRADKALYISKNQGRNRVTCASVAEECEVA